MGSELTTDGCFFMVSNRAVGCIPSILLDELMLFSLLLLLDPSSDESDGRGWMTAIRLSRCCCDIDRCDDSVLRSAGRLQHVRVLIIFSYTESTCPLYASFRSIDGRRPERPV